MMRIAAVDRCSTDGDEVIPITQFFPDDIRKSANYDDVKKDTVSFVRDYLQSKYDRIQVWDKKQEDGYNDPDQWKDDVADTILPARYVLRTQGLDLDEWATTAGPSYDFGTDRGNAQFLSALLASDIEKTDPDLKPFLHYSKGLQFGGNAVGMDEHGGGNDKATDLVYCNLLKQKSLRAFSGDKTVGKASCEMPAVNPVSPQTNTVLTATSQISSRILSKPSALGRCIQCHTGALPIGPRIPFNDEVALRSAMKQPFPRAGSPTLAEQIRKRLKARGDQRMPQGLPLNDGQISDLENYFDSLQ